MYYSFNSNLSLYLSLFISLIMITSLYFIGEVIIKFFNADKLFDFIKIQCLNFLVGFTFINILLEYFTVFSDADKLIINYFSYTIIISGCYLASKRLIKNGVIKFKKPINISFEEKFILSILILFFLISLAPITNEDSLNYHLGVPLSMLKEGHFNWHYEWFHYGLFGISEYLNLVSLQLNAEQIPNLSQFFSFIAIMGLFYPTNINQNQKLIYRNTLILILLTTPVLLFLASAAKPQLNAISLTTVVFFLILKDKLNFLKLTNSHILFVGFLLSSACATKLNFFISSLTLILLMAFINHKTIIDKTKIIQNLKIFLLFLITALITFLPIIVKKANSFPINSFSDFFIPVPSSLPGSSVFLQYLRNYKDSSISFPLSLLLPSSIGNVSMVLGLNLILLIAILLINKFKKYYILFFVLMFILMSAIIGQNTARFFFEPFIWLILYAFYEVRFLNFKNFKFIKYIGYTLGIGSIIILSFAAFNLSIGIINVSLREKVLVKNANGYTLSKWVNNKLPLSSKIIVDHNVKCFFKAEVYSSDWCNYVNLNKNEEAFYVNYLKNKNIEYIVLVEENKPQDSKLFKYCNKLIFGPFKFKKATRNPFNSGKQLTAWIYSPKL